MQRQLSPYEKNQLLKFGLSADIADTDQTPVEYLTGHVDFCGHDFLVTPHTLIPRIETQELVSLALSHLKSMIYDLKSPHVVDVGTGSGALGISLFLKLIKKNSPPRRGPFSGQLTLSDLSLEALTTARLNALRLLPADSQPVILQSDLLADFPPQTFDLITANLPYIPSARIETLDPSVRDYEPHIALDGGTDGALLINRLLQQLPDHLNPNGQALFEVDHTHTLDIFRTTTHFKAQLLPDSRGHTRFLKLTRI